MSQPFKTIGVVGKFAAPTVSSALCQLGRYLRTKTVTVKLDAETAAVWPNHGFDVADHHEMATSCDLIIVVGGDGTFLGVARALGEVNDVSLVGLNLGRLGFLTDISPDRTEEKLDQILKGAFLEEDRFMLHCTVSRKGEVISRSCAFNDVVVHKRDVARMIELDTFIDDTFISTIHADGLITATPTGSTAYALSGGGPLMEPELNVVVLVPICPHTLSNRPIVVCADSVTKIEVKGKENDEAQMSCDGQVGQALVPGDIITISKHPSVIRLIHPADHNHFHILRAKMGWS
ncbi:MAG: NAD(+) kinase [Gammaproteobacteria bacterium]|nr:NAD(+) kinase [Gammaproteobacteria bacterium]